jgi:hypothetical protein
MNEVLYEEALAKLAYVEEAKRVARALIERLCNPSRSNMFLSMRNREHAADCICEVLDDLFYEEYASAEKIVAVWEREDYLRAVKEWE